MAAFPLQLRPGEEVLVDVRPHWSFLGAPLVVALVALSIGVGLDIGLTRSSTDLHWAEGVLVAVGSVWFVVRFARWRRTGVVLTSERVIDQWGAHRRNRVDVPYVSIEQVIVDQGFLRASIGTGGLEIVVWEEGPLHTIHHCRKPAVVARIITRRLTPPDNDHPTDTI